MDSEYDRKFEEMKKYIPFLESMIARLENTSTGSSNPRQAQLDKIRSLRDLLLDKKKRMKMDNLLKCEQVLINLYTKVEQRDTLPGIQPASEMIPPKDNTDLNVARNKLKTVTSKTHEAETLPEIARATETDVICTPGSKEPALFQRRPNKGSLSPVKHSSIDKSPQKSSSKRNYTRVLVSPDRSERLWSPSEGISVDQNLFSRRSPARTSRRQSPSYHRRERKKSSKQESHSRKSKDLNITLKVPEERLNSLNTKDILSRIINCSDGDVDITTLRELRTQILGELKHTGANEDISDLILKSYRNKKNKKSQSKNKADVEEGELSDSESEAIENIYGNLVVVEKDKNKDASSNQSKSSAEQDPVSRKIQICLVINSDKEDTSSETSKNKNVTENQKICDITDFEMFDENNAAKSAKPAYSEKNTDIDKESASQKNSTSLSPVKTDMNNSTDIISIEDVDSVKDQITNYGGEVIDMHNFDLQDNPNNAFLIDIPRSVPESEPAPFKVNFYKPIGSEATETIDSHNEESTNKSLDQRKVRDKSAEKLSDPKKPLEMSEKDVRSISKDKSSDNTENSEPVKCKTDVATTNSSNLSSKSTVNMDAEIPLLNEPTVLPAKKDVVSEIDILQALKNEILSDSISIPGAEAATPALHQPKVTKVSNAQELPKKRISIENYKRKSVPSNKLPLFVNNPGIAASKKESLKQSLKLTEKEVERFNLISKIALDDESDDEKDTDLKSPDEMDLAPKSPDMDFSDNTPVSPPVIIPADPVKIVVANSKADVDMRKLPMMSPNTSTITSPFAPSTPVQIKNDGSSEVRNSIDKPEIKRPVLPVDPRIRKEALLPTPPVAFPNMTPSRIPNVAANMTPNGRSFEYNPNRPFNTDDNGRKHVYAPMFPVQDNQVDRKSVWEPSERSPVDKPNWEMSKTERDKSSGPKWEDRNRNSYSQRDDGPRPRYTDSNYDIGYNRSRNDRNGRDECYRQEGLQPSNYYSRSDCPATPTPSFGRGDAPSTPSHYFGRTECPRTPSHPFGRSETSNHSFGMLEPPRTPSHPFGRSEAPMTPTHPFGRSEAPMTPSHPFGRSEAPMTPSHPFGRSDYSYANPSPKYGKAQDPRLNRSYDHDRHRYHRNDPRSNNREQSLSRNDIKPYTPDQTYRREQITRREPSVGRAMPSESDRDRLYSRDRGHESGNSRPFADMGSRPSFQREPSASRSDNRARASSVGRSIRSNELSVESHAGRAFTIDTSVNSTFQKFLDSHGNSDSTSDARRLRASSVGRSLARESSVGRSLPTSLSHKMQENNRDRFKRAQSVGREAASSGTVKSFKDVKAEFESYRSNYRTFNKDCKNMYPTSATENTHSRDPRVRREKNDKPPDTKQGLNKTHNRESYKEVKKVNYRDPRQRKEQKLKEKLNYQHERNRASHDRHSYGISSDSGTKNAIINSVKNYKIPKIKRPEPEEKPVEPVKENDKGESKISPASSHVKGTKQKSTASSDVKDLKQKSTAPLVQNEKKNKNEKKKSDKMSSKKADNDDDKNNSTVKTEKRVTRSGRNIEGKETSFVTSEDDEIIPTRTRKFKKVIYDSDSDDTVSKTNVTRKTKNHTTSPKKYFNKNKKVQLDKGEEKRENNSEFEVANETSNKDIDPEDNQETMDSSFGLDDMNLFPDNIITDPVLDNINALIADLDNDLETSKTGTTCNDLFNDISIENMLEKITSSPIKPDTKKSIEQSARTDTVKKDLIDDFKITTEKFPEKCTSISPLKSGTKNIMLENADITANTAKVDLFDKLKNETEPNETKCETQKTMCEKSVIITDDKHAECSNDGQCTDFKQMDSQSDLPIHDKNDIEPVVSTSVIEEKLCTKDQSLDSEVNPDGRSTPDSTNDAEIVTKSTSETTGEKPDSTIEKQCEMNSDISSTHDAEDKIVKENVEIPKEQSSQIDSIGSLLSILQDKSKIKELLSMLGDQSGENEKIKKKLEKLSEIVSDDEDTNDKIEEDTTTILNTGDKNELKLTKQDDQENFPQEIELYQSKEPESEKLIQIEPNVQSNNELLKSQPAGAQENEGDECETKPTSCDETTDTTKNNQEQEQQEVSSDVDNEGNESQNDNDEEGEKEPDSPKTRKKTIKKIPKRLKGGKWKKGKTVKKVLGEGKRVTRSEAAGLLSKPKPKIPSRELRQLQESIKEMFMSDTILNASGIRMCRLAKMVDEKKSEALVNEPEPIVVLEKVKHVEENEEKPIRKKPGPKPKIKSAVTSPDEKKYREDEKKNIENEKPLVKYKPGPKSKTKIPQFEKDPYDFETESVNESKSSEKGLASGSDSECDSLASSKSFGSTELLIELKKKPKRKRGGWKAGVIKPKNKKRKLDLKLAQSPPPKPTPEVKRTFTIPDLNCFTDKNYCFSKDSTEYSCRLCKSTHSRQDIVFHYKKHHPHSEIPLSRMSPEIAREAIEQCGDVDFGMVSKIPTEKYTCRFCFIDFGKRRAVLETFFWHVVSMHTGEYKQLCSECINVERCPFNLDIPPPPKDIKGQLIGYICGKCNYSQLSLENLKMHVINRHNDTETEVYTINFAVMTKHTINILMKRCNAEITRTTRSTRSNQSITEPSDDKSEITESEAEMALSGKKPDPEKIDKPKKISFNSKITFENDDNASDISNFANTETSLVKCEQEDVDEDDNQQDSHMDEPFRDDSSANEEEPEPSQTTDKSQVASDDIMNYPHFKINYTDAGNKEYVCCINGKDNHYKTGLLISMKKHVQLKHSEIWDGYCFVCKVIVTSQGQHKFSECLMHFLDSHIDNFPVLEKISKPVEKPVTPAVTPEPTERAPTPYINVRPLSELVEPVEPPVDIPAMPVIDSVISLVPPTVEPPHPSPTYPVTRKETQPSKEYKYEEAQAEIMSKKHRVVLDAMMTPEKLVQVFKCAGRFCSFTTDSAEDALMHASTHQRVGGTNALLCAYCDFDSSGNSIDLVSHVFKSHGRCRVVCGLCFYRAAASQLVAAHITRVHGTTPAQRSVLKSNTAPALCEPSEENLSRENAVPLYICKQSEQDERCSFRTVTHTKFWEHLTQKHVNATGFNCYICNTISNDATTLVLHLKTHGLKLYHCTLCVFGADNELELLAHAAAKHPAKTPQAYIRTICGMSGNGSFKILPLVELKKAALNPEEVTPNQAKENPVREAERSIELEKLIGHMLDAPATTEQPETEAVTPISEVLPETVVNDAISNLLDDPVAGMATLIPVPPLRPLTVPTPPRPATPAPVETNISKVVTPVLKEEPMDVTPSKDDSEVICLDSDDEDSKQGIINLSDDEKGNDQSSVSFSGVLAAHKIKDIFKCGKCKKTAKSNSGFKKHTSSCFKRGDKYRCAHCPFDTDSEGLYFKHYMDAHYSPACLKCPICPHTESTMYLIKRHIKVMHEPSPFPSDKEYVLGKQNAPRAKSVKRKSSGSASGGTPSKQKRYGPSDIDKLPINPILDESVFCDMCEFNTKVRLNMVRHLQLHAEQQPVPQTAPVNPVPHLETNEKHFDKMVNLASSSIATRAPEKPGKEPTPMVMIPTDKASRLPQYVPERYRFTCGASGCTYISVDEAMLKCHWETLHSGTYDYHCVHCPPHQFLDKSKPLTAARIIAHLKMHDIRLYACSACPYYHHKKQLVDKHTVEVHKGNATVLVAREESTQPTPATPPAAPTMDLKPWQCGLCKFKSMLRPEVVEHCAKMHQSKMQYKCAYCPFRTSVPENVTKHQTTSHPNREHEVFYFYYREGSIPHGPDGTPHWQKQREKTGVDTVKTETDPPPVTTGTILPQIQPQTPATVNLNLVKQEIDTEVHAVQNSIEELCKKYGDFCEPNGLNYKCSLCKVVVEDNKEAMQSHLFEELQYRKWGCRLCSYKAFHQTGLKEHMWTEHKKNQEPIELPVDINVETWVSKQLDYQENLINKNREKLAQQKMLDARPPAPTTSKTIEVQSSASKISKEKLEKIFGSLGAPIDMQFCCPKCLFKTNDDKIIQQHLEAELTRIRWCCSNCPNHFSTYHEAQFHCKSVHTGQNARPVEAARDPNIRSAWVAAVIRAQKLSMNCMPVAVTSDAVRHEENMETNDDENSLLVIRYEEDVPIPEEETSRQRRSSDSDDESLIIDEQTNKKSAPITKCDYCDFTTKYAHVLETHILRHYNLKPFSCPYCNYTGYKAQIGPHINTNHPNQPLIAKKTERPTGPPTVLDFTKIPKKMPLAKKTPEDPLTLVCLVCEKLLSESESKTHTHDQTVTTFAKRGDIVVKCSECLMLFLDNVAMQQHFTSSHPDLSINYAYYKTDHDSRGFLFCSHCNQRFSHLIDLKSHHNLVHSFLKLKYTSKPFALSSNNDSTSGESPSKKQAEETS